MNPNTVKENLSIEHQTLNEYSLESFINPENYIDYFENKMPLDFDKTYNNDDSTGEVVKLIDVFRDLNNKASANKEVFDNLLNLSYCRTVQYPTFGYYEVDSCPELVFDTVDDIKSDSEFINRLIEKIKFNEVENGLGDFNQLDNDYDRLMFAEHVVEVRPDYERMCRYALGSHVSDMDLYGVDDDFYSEGAYEKLGLAGCETLNSQYVELEVLSLFGVNMIDIKEESRDCLFDWGVDLTSDNYDRLKNTTKSGSLGERIEMANVFLATQFGDVFGDRLLTISEKLDINQSQEIYRNINKIRFDSKEIATFFENSTDGLDQAVHTAWIKRVTEVLSVISDTEANEDDIKDAIGALGVIRYATEKVFEGLSGELTQLTNDGTEEFDGDGKKIDYRTYKSNNGLTVTMRRNREKIIVKTKDEDGNEGIKTRYRSPRIGFSIKIPADLIPDSAKTGNSKIDKDKRLNIRLDCDNDVSTLGSLSLDIGSLPSHCEGASQVALFIGKYFEDVGGHLANGIENGHQVREPFESVQVNFDNFGKEIIDPIVSEKLTIVPYSKKSAA